MRDLLMQRMLAAVAGAGDVNAMSLQPDEVAVQQVGRPSKSHRSILLHCDLVTIGTISLFALWSGVPNRARAWGLQLFAVHGDPFVPLNSPKSQQQRSDVKQKFREVPFSDL
jgi:hypothetical protein